MEKRYAIIGADNKVINCIVWNGITEFDYGESEGNHLVSLDSVSSYGIGWIFDPATNTFTDPNPPPPPEEITT